MKNRAGTVGRAGLGPLLGQLPAGVRVHLVGHSFGARLMSFALAGLPGGPSPVRAVTLLEGAFSHFAFASPLPFDAARSGALAGMASRVNGPLVACFSEHDGALGRFYPLASFAAQEDAAAAVNPSSRWGAIGANGAQGVGATLEGVQPVGGRYGFAPGAVLNIDASEVVKAGNPPIGAHSDIVHGQLTWVVLAAGGLA
jgi:pimeloyl-ACP methyl ester carboxylesterase